MEVLSVENDRQTKVLNHFEKKMIEKKVLTNAIIVLQEDFGLTFNEIKQFKKKMNDLERG